MFFAINFIMTIQNVVLDGSKKKKKKKITYKVIENQTKFMFRKYGEGREKRSFG